jgi:hypothetical protein
MVNNPPRRENARPQHMRRSGIISSAEIEAAVKASGIQDDDDTTGTMGIRDNKDFRKNAEQVRKGK